MLQCVEGRIVIADREDDLWEEDGFIFLKIGNKNKALRMKRIRVEKLCGFKCDFHLKLIEKLTDYWKNN